MRVPLTATLASFSVLLSLASAADNTRLIHEFPKGTWLENIAVRPSGYILVTTIQPNPDIYMINPAQAQPKPELVYRFPDALSCLGITETTPDNFYVVVSNATLETLTATDNRIYNVNFPADNGPVAVSLVATLPSAGALNGLTTLDNTTILAADSRKGVVWSIDTTTGAKRIVLNDTLMSPQGPAPNLGVNGIHIRGSTLYFTSTQQALLARVSINPDGTAAGKPVKIATTPGGFDYDDFALGRCADEFLATGGDNTIARVDRRGRQRVIAGNVNSTQIAEPTSAAFGRTALDANVLYVTTGGGLGIPVNGDETVGGQLVAVDVNERCN